MNDWTSVNRLSQLAAAACGDNTITIYENSVRLWGGSVIAACRSSQERFLIAAAPQKSALPAAFEGEVKETAEAAVKVIPHTAANAATLRELFPWCAPKSLRGIKSTIGCGDRLGLATRGQLAAVREYDAAPVLAQQSIRELNMTGRTFRGVVDDACFMVYEAGYEAGFGADGDHLKTLADIDNALDAGMPMITLDLSDVMNAAAGDWSPAKIEEAFANGSAADRERILSAYAGKNFQAENHSIEMDELTAKRCSVMYDKALDFAEVVHRKLVDRRGADGFDLEISIDETGSPTLPSHHWYIASELRRRGVDFTGMAPRFIGEFQKAVDYIGDLAEFDRQFAVHAAIARTFGAYRISVHSGSDKFSVYPTIGRETERTLHLKTAGTSWLVAVTVIAQHRPELYRAMHRCAEKNFDAMLKLYHITADLSRIPALDTLSDAELPRLMEHADARQLLHITYGPILTSDLRAPFFQAMHELEKEYDAALKAHFEHHLTELGLPRR